MSQYHVIHMHAQVNIWTERTEELSSLRKQLCTIVKDKDRSI